ncbi:IS3 family transposase [Mycoplasmopsis bovirhinis]|uniref:IS3 family transposase n=1 Tax=Mycoplasmopsis bovirhinis TaxID=29553 RepID=UPI001CB7A282|nr:IS3 family transposase [Mycoplasmopsis bovirhinis]
MPDLVKRDYNSCNDNIYATVVTYIQAPKDIKQNHIYLSAIIDHKTKFVTYELSQKIKEFINWYNYKRIR